MGSADRAPVWDEMGTPLSLVRSGLRHCPFDRSLLLGLGLVPQETLVPRELGYPRAQLLGSNELESWGYSSGLLFGTTQEPL